MLSSFDILLDVKTFVLYTEKKNKRRLPKQTEIALKSLQSQYVRLGSKDVRFECL
jgi:hypothetical protein